MEVCSPGLFKGSTSQSQDGPRAERPKTLRRLRNVYEGGGGGGSGGVGLAEDGEEVVCKRPGRGGGCPGVSGGAGDKSLSILSPFDEQEEWAKISEIMASFGSGLARDSVFVSELEKEFQSRMVLTHSSSNSPIVGSSVGQWLASLGLAEYESLFHNNGFDDLDFINGVIEAQDLKDMGLNSDSDINTILGAARSLPCKVNNNLSANKNNNNSMDAVSTADGSVAVSPVETWLKSIHLDCYVDTFHKHLYKDMERVRRIWEVELTAVLEIHKAGHRRRILTSVSGHQQPGPNLEDINADLNQLKSNIQQLKEEIREKLPATNTGTLRHSHKKSRPPPPPIVAPSTNGSAVDLEIREPSELLVGVPATLTTQWRHRPHALVAGIVTYVANYLGSTVVKELRGTESTKKSIQKLKRSTREAKSTPDIVLAISYRGVQFLNTLTQELVCEHEIRNIHCACQDADDLTHFAYITKDHTSKSHYCHVFCVQTMDQATEVIMTLGQAFEVAYQMALREQFSTASPSPRGGHTRSQSANILATPPVSTHTPVNHTRSLSVNEVKVNGQQVKEMSQTSSEEQQTMTSPLQTPKINAPIVQTEEL